MCKSPSQIHFALGTSLANAKPQVEVPCYSAICLKGKAQANLEAMAKVKAKAQAKAKIKVQAKV